MWFTAALTRAKQLPPFERFTQPPPQAMLVQSADEQHLVLQQLSARLGVALRRVPWSPPDGESR